MKWIRAFEEMEWDEPSFKKVDYDDFNDSPFPKDLSL